MDSLSTKETQMTDKVYPCTLNGRLDIREDGTAVLYVRYPIGLNNGGMKVVRIYDSDQLKRTIARLGIDPENPIREVP